MTLPPTSHKLGASLERRGRSLLHQQCWLWGQDVRREQGNLMVERGFHRLRPPLAEPSSTQYTLQLTACPAQLIHLWGFGFFYGTSQSGLFLNRYEFIPRSAPGEERFFNAQEMSALKRAHSLSLLPAALRWIAGYEEWVLTTCGIAYRDTCMRAWTRRRIPCVRLPILWNELAKEIERILAVKPADNQARAFFL